jgi:hypothetical protein
LPWGTGNKKCDMSRIRDMKMLWLIRMDSKGREVELARLERKGNGRRSTW